jgi:hypothetical protein
MHIRQSKIPAGIVICQPLMIETHLMQNRGVQIMKLNLVLGNRHPEFVGRTINRTPLEAATSHPDRVSVNVMVPPTLFTSFVPDRVVGVRPSCRPGLQACLPRGLAPPFDEPSTCSAPARSRCPSRESAVARLLREIKNVRRGGLHPKRELTQPAVSPQTRDGQSYLYRERY